MCLHSVTKHFFFVSHLFLFMPCTRQSHDYPSRTSLGNGSMNGKKIMSPFYSKSIKWNHLPSIIRHALHTHKKPHTRPHIHITHTRIQQYLDSWTIIQSQMSAYIMYMLLYLTEALCAMRIYSFVSMIVPKISPSHNHNNTTTNWHHTLEHPRKIKLDTENRKAKTSSDATNSLNKKKNENRPILPSITPKFTSVVYIFLAFSLSSPD